MTNRSLSQALNTENFRIVDSHCHLGGYLEFGIPWGDADDMVAQMDSMGVEKVALTTMVSLNIDPARGNDVTAAAMKKYPERIIGMATFNPNREEEILPELTRCIDTLGMSMIKIHCDFSFCPMSRKSYDVVYGFAAERKLPILNHDWQSPDRLEDLAKRYPQIRFVQAHSGGLWDGHREDRYFMVARDYENVYLDLCASPVYYDALEKLVDICGAGKILYGSDTGFLSMSFGLGKIMMAALSDEDKQKILADNFLKIIAKRN